MAFGQLMIRRGGASVAFLLAYLLHRLLTFFQYFSLEESTIVRKIMYSIMLIVPLLFNVAIILLASYATYIYIASVFAFGVLLVNARRINLSHCNFR